MKDSVIHNLFPTPIYINNLDRSFTKEELQFVDEQKKHCNKNKGNISTKDSYILNKKEFINIKRFLNKCCKDYLKKIICPKNKIDLYITQSWLNYTEENQFHHQHQHPNSVISGVLYFNCDKDNDRILFTKPGYQQIRPEVENFNLWNSQTWWLNIGIGELVMFPSDTIHQVENKKGKNTRISLAFNTFYKGILGSSEEFTELKL